MGDFAVLTRGFTEPGAMALKEVYNAAFNALGDHIAKYEQKLWKVY